MSQSPTVIRVSSLPSYVDCARRDAARSRRKMVEASGFKLREVGQSIGAAIGSGTHAALEAAFRAKMAGGAITMDEFSDRAEAPIKEAIAEGIIWDDTSRNEADAVRQCVKQARSIWSAYGECIEPEGIEEKVAADMGDGFELRGHIDLRGKMSGFIGSGLIDFKTGTMQRANAFQYGGYSLTARANGISVEWAVELYSKRVGVTKPQPDPIQAAYSLVDAERGAYEVAHKVKADVTDFRDNSNPWAFMPNPNSMNCSEKYCPAHGTEFCRAHKGEMTK